ncbi:probable G-protein coupled receptor 156 isoform X2 [Perognathus longimembris pacificus]|uniref:probable G-protein coupled receptor 156 isoform X2 n=1 Tax=Perognathus longimembris pacificus TaxID=214514 RepID=UPI00201888EC|nr:probable G-protein coupled receptor 156 isoform X2 [Perognathus longimembris pacificus]
MESEISCSEFCDSFPGQELDRRPIHDLCRTTVTSSQPSSPSISLSPALLGIVWTFLSCGLLLILFFFAFTIRCRRNRIVKMSSPNLNIVTLLGSCLTYSSAYLFGIQDVLMGSSMETLIQVRLSLLCIGTSLVFGPLLGKSWRLYKVFTQRVPDKRVIIKDLQLLGLVAVLVMADVILLVTWVLTDPIQCLQILGVTGRDVSCSLTNTHFCASHYSDVWITLVLGCKGLLLLYGAYLAGLTDHVSSPPVNQSLAIMVGVNLLVLTAGLLFVVTRYLHSWPNLVFGLTSGGIFICTTTVNCCIFIPQLKQWKAFEGENQTIRRMAKYFSTPNKAFHTQLGEEQGCQPRDQKSSMERLLTEKNAVIESLQEQVNNAKEKLVRLMDGEYTYDAPERAAPIPDAASAHELEIPGPSGCPSASQSDTLMAAADSQCSSASSPHVQSPGALDRNASPSPGQEKTSDFKNLTGHVHSGCSQKLRVEQGQGPQGGDQGPMASHQSYMPDGGACEPQRQSTEEPSAMLPRVSSVVREKLWEVLQELNLDPEVPLSTSPSCPPKPRKSSATRSPQKLLHSRDLGFSPYVVRRRRAAPRASLHLPGSTPSHGRHRAGRTASGAHKELNVKNEESPQQNLQSANVKIPRLSSKKASPLPGPPGKLSTLEGIEQCQTESPEAMGHHAAFPHQPFSPTQAQRPTVPRVPHSSDLPGQQQLQLPGSSLWPSMSAHCNYLDTESSSSDEFFCRCHRPYCEICFQSSSDSSDSDTSDTDPEPARGPASWEKLWAHSKPIVNFKDDLKPTLV